MRRQLIRSAIALAALALTAAGLAGAAGAPLAGQRGTLWVTNRALNNVAVFEGATGKLLATIAVGKEPNSVVVPRGTAKAYVTNESSDAVSVISTMTYQIVKEIKISPRPHHIRASRDGSRIFVSEFGANRVAVVDTASDTVVGEYTTNASTAARNHSSWITRDGKTLWLVNEVANEVTAVDAATGQMQLAVPVGNRPSEVIVSPDGKRAYVSIRGGENKIKVIDTSTKTITSEVTLPTQPDTLQLTPDGKQLMVGLRGTPAQLAVIDTATMTVKTTVDLAGTGTIAGHNWLSANGLFSFVTFEGGSAPGVAVVEHRSNTVVAVYPYPDGGRPHGIFYDDPAASDGPAVTLGPGATKVKVTANGLVPLRVTCSADAVGFCRGRATIAGAASAEFSLQPGSAATVAVALPSKVLAQLRRAKTLRLRVTATAIDELENSRASSAMLIVTAPKAKPRMKR